MAEVFRNPEIFVRDLSIDVNWKKFKYLCDSGLLWVVETGVEIHIITKPANMFTKLPSQVM